MDANRDTDRMEIGEARRAVIALARLTEPETVAAEVALGRVTAEPVSARMAAPHYRGAAMDGIAVRAAATTTATASTPILLIDTAAAPHAEVPGSSVCVVVDTGNALPAWADAVVRREATRATASGYEITSPVAPGRDVRAIGEDVAADAPLLPRGHRIRAFDVGALIATGNDTVSVRRAPRIAVIATGDEIVEPGTAPRDGQVIEFNSRMLAGFAAEAGGVSTYLGRAKDDVAALTTSIRDAARTFDLVCVIAGSSKGRKDFTLAALAACGTVSFRGVAMMPGRPTGLAVVDGTAVLAIPGYPVSAVAAYRELVVPFVTASLGAAAPHVETVDAVVARDIPSRLGSEELLRICLTASENRLVAAPLPRGAGSITTLVRADGILRIPASSEGLSRGSRVRIELLRPLGEVGQAVVVAGTPHPSFAALEDRRRLSGDNLRVAYLGLSDLDATSALAAGEAHCALLPGGDARALAETTEWLDQRLPGWTGYTIDRSGQPDSLLAILPGLPHGAIERAFSEWPAVAAAIGFRVRSTGSGAARS